MRILVVSPVLPHPAATHGGAVCLGSLLEGLCRHADVALASFIKPSELRWGSPVAPGLAETATVALPQYLDLAGKTLWTHKLRMLSRWGLQRKPVLVAKHWSPAMAATLLRITREFRPHAVLLEFAVMAQYLRLFDHLPTVLTDHECGDPLPCDIGPWGLGRGRDRRLWASYVRHTYPHARLVQALNEEDAARLRGMLGRPVEVRPPVVPLPDEPVAPRAAPPRALFLGDYAHHPNPDAVRYLAQRVWPLVRARAPTAELWLAGPRASKAVKALAEQPGVRVLGYVDELPHLLGQIRLMLVPLFSGGGSRIKVLTALAHGVPVVSNRIGLRGVHAPATAVFREESPEGLATATLRLLDEAGLAGRMGAAARAWAEDRLDPEHLARDQVERIGRLLTPAPAERLKLRS